MGHDEAAATSRGCYQVTSTRQHAGPDMNRIGALPQTDGDWRCVFAGHLELRSAAEAAPFVERRFRAEFRVAEPRDD
jgi:hypothetical protein